MTPVDNRYSIFPIKHPNLWEHFKVHQRAIWTLEELDFARDLQDLPKLSPGELHFVTWVLAFFSQSDGIVNENLAIRFYRDVEIPEARAFYTMQMLIETVHAETYGKLIETYVSDSQEQKRLFNAIENIPTIAEKAKWAMRWIDSQEDFAKRLVAFAVVEGIFFSGSFCAIFWFRKRGLLPGLASANNLIARDEGLHWVFAAELFKEMGLKLKPEEFKEIVTEAVNIERHFVTDALPVSLIGMNADLMCQYIQYTADRLCEKFGYDKIYKVENPFDFMALADLELKGNFFEVRTTEYQKPISRSLDFDAEF
jgi:ribonucleoside-diphosphate reductase beta chain